MKENYKEVKRVVMFLMLFALIYVIDANAMTAPAAGEFAYTVYDVTVNKVLKGPIGFATGIFLICMGVAQGVQSKLIPAAATAVCGGALVNADSIVTSLGAVF